MEAWKWWQVFGIMCESESWERKKVCREKYGVGADTGLEVERRGWTGLVNSENYILTLNLTFYN